MKKTTINSGDKNQEDKFIKLAKLNKEQFVVRCSILDDYDERSHLKQSIFIGFYNMSWFIILQFLVSRPILRFFKGQDLYDYYFLNSVQQDFFLVLFCWPCIILWSYSSYLLQLLALQDLPRFWVGIIQHTTQSIPFIISLIIVILKNWCTTHTGFIIILTISYFGKMHSYTMANLAYRDEYLRYKKTNNKDYLSELNNYPNNINLKNFTHYLFTPCICYQASYPVDPHPIRITYLARKIGQLISLLMLQYIILSEVIIPTLILGDSINLIEMISRILCSVTVYVMVLFFTMFEVFFNILGELTSFGDREFYQDFWNSNHLEEFNRKWNRPVHKFLYKHIYLHLHNVHNYGKIESQFLTFLFSALLHELVLIMMFKTVHPILFVCMLLQVPLIMITKNLPIDKTYQNLLFYTMAFNGLPVIMALYVREKNIHQLYLE